MGGLGREVGRGVHACRGALVLMRGEALSGGEAVELARVGEALLRRVSAKLCGKGGETRLRLRRKAPGTLQGRRRGSVRRSRG